jgi:hypothetical protein
LLLSSFQDVILNPLIVIIRISQSQEPSSRLDTHEPWKLTGNEAVFHIEI